jgi:selT/selW/selH-like putative selenoprotein
LALKDGVKSLTLTAGARGAFEVLVDGKKIYSKLQTGEFPDFGAIAKTVQKMC